MLKRLSIVAAIVALAAIASPVGAQKPDPAPVTIDLSKGVLTQSHCKTTIGCAHRNVKGSSDVFESVDTSSELVQHILTYRIDGPWSGDTGQPQGRLALAVGYELINPTGTAGNVICATAKHKDGVAHDCARGVAREGRLVLPISSHGVETLWIHFVAMPLSLGNVYRVLSPEIVVAPTSGGSGAPGLQGPGPQGPGSNAPGSQAPGPHGPGSNGPDRSSVLDLQDGALRQKNCQVPIDCLHGQVHLDAGRFSSVVGKPPQRPPSDNPNAPPVPAANTGGALTLELPVPPLKDFQRTLTFDHAMTGPNGAPGVIKIWTIAGGTVLRSVIAKAGTGTSSFVIAGGTGAVESVFVTFEPFANAGGGVFEISGASFAIGGPSGEPLPVEESTTCEDCDPPASRLDPCGALLDTYYVEAADGLTGNGYRCVSRDGLGFFGEGWWNDFDWGRYAHLGYFAAVPSDPDGVAIDFGFRRTLRIETSPGVFEDQEVRYGRRGPAALQRTVDGTRWHVTSPSGWNEIWTFVPKGEPMPRFVGRMPWDGACGSNGLIRLEVDFGDRENLRRIRCAIPTDLGDLGPDPDRESLPFVWYGVGYVNQAPDEHDVTQYEIDRPHLGWLTTAASSTDATYSVADRCVLADPSGCDSFDDVHIRTVPPETFVPTDRGLAVRARGRWGYDEPRAVGGWAPELWLAIPPGLEGAALPPPTPIEL